MSNPDSPGAPLNLLRGRAPGSKNKRTIEGEDYARDILAQDDEDILVTTVEEEIPTKDGGIRVVSREVTCDRHPRAVKDPVYRALREQARRGVGTAPGQMPPAVFNALSDRAWGKVAQKIKLPGARPLANESEEALEQRLKTLQSALSSAKERTA